MHAVLSDRSGDPAGDFTLTNGADTSILLECNHLRWLGNRPIDERSDRSLVITLATPQGFPTHASPL